MNKRTGSTQTPPLGGFFSSLSEDKEDVFFVTTVESTTPFGVSSDLPGAETSRARASIAERDPDFFFAAAAARGAPSSSSGFTAASFGTPSFSPSLLPREPSSAANRPTCVRPAEARGYAGGAASGSTRNRRGMAPPKREGARSFAAPASSPAARFEDAFRSPPARAGGCPPADASAPADTSCFSRSSPESVAHRLKKRDSCAAAGPNASKLWIAGRSHTES